MHITNQKLSFHIFTVLNILMEHSHDFWHKIYIYHFDQYNELLAIATNIPLLLMAAFVLQGHYIAVLC